MSRKTRILLAEDDPCLNRYVQTLMSQWECELAFEQTAESAIQRAATFSPDICLLGCVIPGMSGAKAAIELLKVSPETQIVPWNEPVPPQVLDALKAQGCEIGTLAAPFDEEELRAVCFPWQEKRAAANDAARVLFWALRAYRRLFSLVMRNDTCSLRSRDIPS